MGKKIDVQILGNYFSFNLPNDVAPKDFVDIIDYVENKIKIIRRSAPGLDSYKLALLSSINIAEEMFSLKKENAELKNFLKKLDGMVPKIDIKNANEKQVKLLPEQ